MFTTALFGLLKYSRETFVCVISEWAVDLVSFCLNGYVNIFNRPSYGRMSTAIDRAKLTLWLRFRQSSESVLEETTLQPYKELAGTICVGGF